MLPLDPQRPGPDRAPGRADAGAVRTVAGEAVAAVEVTALLDFDGERPGGERQDESATYGQQGRDRKRRLWRIRDGSVGGQTPYRA